MNKVILTGRITAKPELKKTQKGTAYTSSSIAVQRDLKNAAGEYEVDFINFTAWDKQAEYLCKYADKGYKLELVGRWQTRNYEDKDGNKRVANEVVVEQASAFNPHPKGDVPADASSNIAEEEIPF